MKSGEVKLFAAILVVAIILVAVALVPMLTARDPRKPAPPPRGLTGEELAPPSARSLGNPKARYTLVEFGDYQCGLCKTAHDRSKGWIKKYGDRLRYVFYFYAAVTHLHSRSMARAAEAAAEQGKYWEMHNLLFQNAPTMSKLSPKEGDELIMKLAAKLKLDMIKFRAALQGPSTDKAVTAGEDLAVRAGVQSTPHFFIVTPDGKIDRLQFLDNVEQWLKDPTKFK